MYINMNTPVYMPPAYGSCIRIASRSPEGQSLDYDASTDELILTGIAMAPSGNHSRGLAGQAATTHAILKGPAAQCRPNGQLEFKYGEDELY